MSTLHAHSKTNRFIALRPVFILATLAAVNVSLLGQVTDSNIVGRVTDATRGAVANAKLVATNKDTNINYDATSDRVGEYRINDVPVGRYDLAVTAAGFAPKTIANVSADLNHTASVNVSLAVGSITTDIEVTEAPALIETSTSTLQTMYDSNIALNSPVTGISRATNGAGIYNLSLLGAGVASSGGIGQGEGPSVAGQRPENNAFSIDGVANNDPTNTGPQIYVSDEAIAEMNVAQNQFSAEFGGASGGLFNIIVKTGTNQLHGSFFEYFQNRHLNAVDYSQVVAGNRTNPRYDNNRFGASIGGPVLRNKLFYYGNYEYNPLGRAAVPGNPVEAPTAAGIALLNGMMSNLSRTNLSVFEKYVPVASTAAPGAFTSVNGVSVPLGGLSFASPNYNNAYHAIVAVDYNLSQKDRLLGRFIYDNSTGIDARANLPVFFQPNPSINKSVSVSEFHFFSPSLENELRVAYRRNNSSTSAGNFQFPGLTAFPNLSFDDLHLQLGPDPTTPNGQISNSSSVQDTLTKTWGRHTLKAGYSINDVILTAVGTQRERGDYDYASLQQFLLDQQPSGSAFGTPNSGERSGGAQSGIPLGSLQNAAFFQDDWRMLRNLTFNLGVRYEYVTVPVGSRAQQYSAIADVPGVIMFNAPQASKKDWSPRLGFAFSPGADGKWSVRGGIGRFFDNVYGALSGDAAPAFYQTTQDVNSAAPVSSFLANGGLTGIAPNQTTPAQARAAISDYIWNRNRPYALTGTLGVQRLLGKDYVVEARYVYTKGVHLWNQTRLNIVSTVSPSNSLPTYFTTPTAAQLAVDKLTLGAVGSTIVPGGTATLPYNDLAVYGFKNPISGYEPWGNSRYNGLALQINKRYSRGFSYIAAYTWSHNFDDSTATNFTTILSPRRGQDFQNVRSEWADSALDHRQRLTLTAVYEFNPFRQAKWYFRSLLGNWTVSGTYTFQSPEYATVQDGIDANLNGDPTGDRTIINPAGAANGGTAVNALNAAGQMVPAGSQNIVAYVAVNPNARYVTAGLGALANSGRNTFPLGRTNNIDASLAKKIYIRERYGVQIGAQFFNLFNHSQFTGGYLSDVTPFNTAGINRSVFVPSSPSFGQINQFFPSNSRQLNLVARFTF